MRTLFVILLILSAGPASGQPPVVDPNHIKLSPYHHQELPPELLARIRANTDIFQPIDGVSYEQAVDLYKRDVDPEKNLALYEEMARAYTAFCKQRCKSIAERKEVYKILLLRTIFSESDTLRKAQPKVLTQGEARSLVSLYRIAPKPLEVYESK